MLLSCLIWICLDRQRHLQEHIRYAKSCFVPCVPRLAELNATGWILIHTWIPMRLLAETGGRGGARHAGRRVADSNQQGQASMLAGPWKLAVNQAMRRHARLKHSRSPTNSWSCQRCIWLLTELYKVVYEPRKHVCDSTVLPD